MKKSRSGMQGLYERDAGSGVWWIRWSVAGKIHRQMVGDRDEAISLLATKRLEAQSGKKVRLRAKKVRFSEIAEAFLKKENTEAAGKAARYGDHREVLRGELPDSLLGRVLRRTNRSRPGEAMVPRSASERTEGPDRREGEGVDGIDFSSRTRGNLD